MTWRTLLIFSVTSEKPLNEALSHLLSHNIVCEQQKIEERVVPLASIETILCYPMLPRSHLVLLVALLSAGHGVDAFVTRPTVRKPLSLDSATGSDYLESLSNLASGSVLARSGSSAEYLNSLSRITMSTPDLTSYSGSFDDTLSSSMSFLDAVNNEFASPFAGTNTHFVSDVPTSPLYDQPSVQIPVASPYISDIPNPSISYPDMNNEASISQAPAGFDGSSYLSEVPVDAEPAISRISADLDVSRVSDLAVGASNDLATNTGTPPIQTLADVAAAKTPETSYAVQEASNTPIPTPVDIPAYSTIKDAVSNTLQETATAIASVSEQWTAVRASGGTQGLVNEASAALQNGAKQLAQGGVDAVNGVSLQAADAAQATVKAAGDLTPLQVAEAVGEGLIRFGSLMVSLLGFLVENVSDATLDGIVAKAMTSIDNIVQGAVDTVLDQVDQIGHLTLIEVAENLTTLVVLVSKLLWQVLNGVVSITSGKSVSDWVSTAVSVAQGEVTTLSSTIQLAADDVSHRSLTDLSYSLTTYLDSMATSVNTAIASTGSNALLDGSSVDLASTVLQNF